MNSRTPQPASPIRKNLGIGVIYLILSLLLVVCLLPFLIMIINATHSTSELMTGLYLLPGTSFLENYRNMDKMIDIWQGFRNSIVITGLSTLLSAYFGALTAYGLAKFTFKGKHLIFWTILVSMMLPVQVGVVGLFRLSKFLHILDTFVPLILPSIANASTIFFVHQYMQSSLPDSLLESARIEGCGEVRIFNTIALPLVKPAVATMSIFNFVSYWNNFLIPMILLFNQEHFTIPLLIMNLRGAFNRDFGATYAGVALSIVPIIIMYAFLSKNITHGLMAGAVKE